MRVLVAEDHQTLARSIADGLRDEGFVEGRNLVLERRFADYVPDRFSVLARELASDKVDVFFAPATTMARQARPSQVIMRIW